MLLPRFSLKILLILVTVFSLLSVVFAMAYQGQPWAIAVSVCIWALLAAPVIYAILYGCVSVCLVLIQVASPRPTTSSPFRSQAAPAPVVSETQE